MLFFSLKPLFIFLSPLSIHLPFLWPFFLAQRQHMAIFIACLSYIGVESSGCCLSSASLSLSLGMSHYCSTVLAVEESPKSSVTSCSHIYCSLSHRYNDNIYTHAYICYVYVIKSHYFLTNWHKKVTIRGSATIILAVSMLFHSARSTPYFISLTPIPDNAFASHKLR